MNIQVCVPDQYNALPPQHNQGQEICSHIPDPTSTFERKKLISLLKQRYGNNIDANTASTPKHISISTASDGDVAKGKKTLQHCERVLVHTTPLKKNICDENRELYHHGGVHHSPAALNGSWDHISGTGSEGSDDSVPMQCRHVVHEKMPSSQHTIIRRSDSVDASDGSKNGSCEWLMPLPVVSSGGLSKGVAFLQYLDDVKRVRLPSTVTSIDTVQALFVTSFTDHVRMQDFEDGLKVVYIKDSDTGTYYMLEDVSDVTNHCFLKVHEKSPSWKSSNTSQLSQKDSYTGSDVVTNSRTQSNNSSMCELVSNSITVNKLNDNSQTDVHIGYEENQNAFQESVLPKQNKLYNETGIIHSTGQVINTIKMPSRKPHQAVNVTNKHPSYKVLKSVSAYPDTTCNDYNDIIIDSLEMARRASNDLSGSSESPHGNTEGDTSGGIAGTGLTLSNDSISKIGTVEDQLEDLSELLKNGIVDVKADHHLHKEISQHTKHRNVISQENFNPDPLETNHGETASVVVQKALLPSYHKPTIMVDVQQQSTPLSSNDGALPPHVIPKALEQVVNNGEVNADKVTVVVEQSTHIYPCRHNEYEVIDDDVLNIGNVGLGSIPGYDGQEKPQQNQPHQMYYNLPTATNSSTSTFSYERIQRKENNVDLEVRPITIDELQHNEQTERGHSTVGSNIVEGDDAEVPGRDSIVDGSSEMHSSTISDTLMGQIMNMELEDLQRSDPSLVQVERFPSKVNKLYINPYAEIDDPVLVDAFDGESCPANSEPPNVNADKCKDGSLCSTWETDGSTSMRHLYSKISKVTVLPGSVVSGAFNESFTEWGENFQVGTRDIANCLGSVSAPGFNKLEHSAQCVYCSLKQLKSHLCDLRKCHTDGVRSFKADIQKKLLEFRKKASRVEEGLQQQLEVNNKIIFEDKHPVRERRHRLTADQHLYDQKMSDTEVNLGYLEVEMESVRLSVIEKKYVDDPEKLRCLHLELAQVTRGLAEIKNRFHGLHDMLDVVIADELKIISGEEKFIVEEPLKLDGLIKRCKNLSGTLFTLERLAAVQSEKHDVGQKQQQVHGQLQHQSHKNAPSKVEQTANHSNDGKRNVRFKQKH